MLPPSDKQQAVMVVLRCACPRLQLLFALVALGNRWGINIGVQIMIDIQGKGMLMG